MTPSFALDGSRQGIAAWSETKGTGQVIRVAQHDAGAAAVAPRRAGD
jgi:hypothetical protein